MRLIRLPSCVRHRPLHMRITSHTNVKGAVTCLHGTTKVLTCNEHVERFALLLARECRCCGEQCAVAAVVDVVVDADLSNRNARARNYKKKLIPFYITVCSFQSHYSFVISYCYLRLRCAFDVECVGARIASLVWQIALSRRGQHK